MPTRENTRLLSLHILVISNKMDLVARKPVFGISDRVRMKPFSSATETSQKLEISPIASFRYATFRRANNKHANQTARICRLVCACVVLKPRGQA